jgi:endonuclease YncB( thermonuclease family)
MVARMAFCSACGSPLMDGARFCSTCGAAVGATPPATPSRATPVAHRAWGTFRRSPGWAQAAAIAAAAVLCFGLVGLAFGGGQTPAENTVAAPASTEQQPPPDTSATTTPPATTDSAGSGAVPAAFVVDRVVDGDTIVLTSGVRVRLVQIDAPEMGGECYSGAATRLLERALPAGTQVKLLPDSRLDKTDRYGRLLRYVFAGSSNVNVMLVQRGAAAPYFFFGARGRYAGQLMHAALRARAAKRGLWGACRATQLDPNHQVDAVWAAPKPPPSPPPSTSSGGGGGGSCTPGYSPCLVDHGGADYDCAGGSGNGPYYTQPGVTYSVTGSDPYGLDRDGDGSGCE